MGAHKLRKHVWPFPVHSKTDQQMADRAYELLLQTPNLTNLTVARKLNGQFGRSLHLPSISKVRHIVWDEITHDNRWREYNVADRPSHIADFSNPPHDPPPAQTIARAEAAPPPSTAPRPPPPEFDKHGMTPSLQAACELLREALAEHPFYVAVSVRIGSDGGAVIIPEPRAMVVVPDRKEAATLRIAAIPPGPSSEVPTNGATPSHRAAVADTLPPEDLRKSTPAEAVEAANAVASVVVATGPTSLPKKKKQYSPEGLARIKAGIARRWDNYNAKKGLPPGLRRRRKEGANGVGIGAVHQGAARVAGTPDAGA